MLALTGWLHHCLVIWVSGLIIGLAISKAILGEGEIAICFLRWSL